MTIDILNHNELNENKLIKKIILYTTVVSIIIIISVIILFTVRKKIYYQNNLLVLKDKIVTNIAISDLEIFSNNDTLIINKKSFKYQIKEIELFNNENPYYQVVLNVLGEFEKNEIVSYKILLRDDNLFNYLTYLIGG